VLARRIYPAGDRVGRKGGEGKGKLKGVQKVENPSWWEKYGSLKGRVFHSRTHEEGLAFKKLKKTERKTRPQTKLKTLAD